MSKITTFTHIVVSFFSASFLLFFCLIFLYRFALGPEELGTKIQPGTSSCNKVITSRLCGCFYDSQSVHNVYTHLSVFVTTLTGRNGGLARPSVSPSVRPSVRPYPLDCPSNWKARRLRETEIGVSVPQDRSNRCAKFQFRRSTEFGSLQRW